MGDHLDRILTDLTRHEGLFRLDREELGDQLLDHAADGCRESFDAQRGPDGEGWPPLNSDYAAWKARHFPGAPMLVREGVLRNDPEFDGEREINASSAVWTFGQSEQARQEAVWNQEGDPWRNRPPRPFIGFTESSEAKAAETLENHFKENV